jgi:hypothetical protein
VSNERLISEWWIGKAVEGTGRGLIVRYYPSLRLEKVTKNLSQNSQFPGRDLNPGLPEYEAGVLTTRQRCSIPVLVYLSLSVYLIPSFLRYSFSLRTESCFLRAKDCQSVSMTTHVPLLQLLRVPVFPLPLSLHWWSVVRNGDAPTFQAVTDT